MVAYFFALNLTEWFILFCVMKVLESCNENNVWTFSVLEWIRNYRRRFQRILMEGVLLVRPRTRDICACYDRVESFAMQVKEGALVLLHGAVWHMRCALACMCLIVRN